uniref:HTH OST-type domain-containing protein n=1 Tax=Stomoxys calcitrans TaxID=35570 RepID=A0A1I8NSS4_STOCA
MEIGFLKEVKAILKSLVISCPDKITIDQLNRDFREVEGHFIPFRKLGYNNLEQFLRSIPDTLLVSGTGHSAQVYFVNNEKSAHIHEMIMTQRKPRPRARGKSKGKGVGTNLYRNQSCGRNNNKFSPAASTNQRMYGQQLSPFEITKRNVSTRRVTAREVPLNLQTNMQKSAALNNKGAVNNTQLNGTNGLAAVNVLPQPNGIQQQMMQMAAQLIATQTPDRNEVQPNTLPSIQQKAASCVDINRKYQEYTKQLASLMSSSCHITPPSMKSVSFSPEIHKDGYCAHDSKPNVPSAALTGVIPPKPKAKLMQNLEKLISESRRVRNPLDTQVDQPKTGATELEVKKPLKTSPKRSESPVNTFKKLMGIHEENVEDIDEAVPEFAATSRVFRLDIPKHTVPYGRKISPCEIPEDVSVGNCMRIFVSEIHNPFRFWFHIHKDQHELDTLMHQIERYYNDLNQNELRIPIACLNPGQICAALFNGMWHRGEIVAPPVNNTVKVSFVDYGTVCEVDICDVKYLCTCFSQLPAQALRGCLSHIIPRGLHWSHEATLYFLSMVSELMIYAKITEIDKENSVFYMVLCDTNKEEVLQINKALVEKKYALYNDDWQDIKVQQKNGKRTHHPREDFPT